MRVLLDDVVAVAVDVVVVEEVGAAGVEAEAEVEAEGFPIGWAMMIGGGVADGADNGVVNSGAGAIWGRPKGSQCRSRGAFGSRGAGGGGGGWRGSATKGGDDGEVVDVTLDMDDRGGDEDGDGGADKVVSSSSSMTEE